MTLEQIALLKESYMKESTRPDGRKSTLGEYMRFLLDGGIDFVTSKDCVVFDDENELLHCICVNDNLATQADFPIKLISSEYAMVQQAESIMSQSNFEKFLNEGFISGMITEDQKNFMIRWSRAINNQALQPMDAEPAYNTNPKVIPKNAGIIKRDEYKYSPTVIKSIDGTIRRYESIVEGLNDLHDGDIVTLKDDITTDTPISISSDVTAIIDLSGNNISINNSTAFKITNGNITIKNSGKSASITSTGEVFRIDGTEGTAPILTIDPGIKLKSDSDCCIFLKGAVKINSAGDMESNGQYSTIQGNGNISNTGSEINITGGSIISSNSEAIYHPQDGILNISNARVEGSTAIYIKSGRVTVANSIIRSTGEKKDYVYNSNGCNSTGDAIVVDYCGYPGSDPVVNINSCTITSLNAGSVECYDKEGNKDPDIAKENVRIYGGLLTPKANVLYTINL